MSKLGAVSAEIQEFIDTKLSSKFWRLNNLYTIKDKDGKERILKLNHSQTKVLQKFRHNKKIILKSRQQGISTLYLAYNLDECIFTPGYEAGIQSYGQKEADKLVDRAELMWDRFPKEILAMISLSIQKNNSTGMFFSNGSVLKIGNFRGDTLQSLHVSELAKIVKKSPEKAKELKTGAFQAVSVKNKITIESTAEGASGLFYDIWMRAERLQRAGIKLSPLDFEAIFLPWYDDPDCNLYHEQTVGESQQKYFSTLESEIGIKLENSQKWWYVAKEDELGEDMKREYPSTPEEAFLQSIEGAYYGKEYKKLVIKENLYDSNLKVHHSFDLGMNDTFTIGLFQIHPDGKPKIIGEFGDNGNGLEYYRDILTAIANKYGFTYGQTYVPHDIKVKELIAGKTRWDALRELGFDTVLVKKHKIMDGIEATRGFLREVEIDPSCNMILSSIQNYRKKYDDRYKVFLDAPVHDEYSHYADMIRYMAMGCKYSPITDIYVQSSYNKSNSFGIDIVGYDV